MLKELIFTGLGGALVLKEKIEDEPREERTCCDNRCIT